MTAGVGAKHLLINGSLGFNKIGIFAVDVWGNEVSAFAEYTVLADDGIVPNPIVWPVCDNERLDFLFTLRYPDRITTFIIALPLNLRLLI